MKTKFKVLGIENGLAKIQRLGGGFLAFTDSEYMDYSVGDSIELLDKDFVSEGQLTEFNAAWDIYTLGYPTHHSF